MQMYQIFENLALIWRSGRLEKNRKSYTMKIISSFDSSVPGNVHKFVKKQVVKSTILAGKNQSLDTGAQDFRK
jgi:hypothetical protein